MSDGVVVIEQEVARVVKVAEEEIAVVVDREVSVVEVEHAGIQGPPGTSASIGIREIPSGAIDGLNVDFVTSQNYAFLQVYLNGLLQSQPDDYLETGTNQFTFSDPATPQIGDRIGVIYLPS